MASKIVLTLLALGCAKGAMAQAWTSNTVPIRQWSSISCSADGTTMAATVFGGNIYSSTNSGTTWATNGASVRGWISAAGSADGLKLVAAAVNDGIYLSTNCGATWNSSDAGPQNWVQVASSANGVHLFAVTYSGYCYYSTNAGKNWHIFTNLPSSQWSSVACSADGTKVLASVSLDDPPIYSSTNSGGTWVKSSIVGQPGAGVVSSADGRRFFAISYGMIYLSTNAGVSWAACASAGAGNALACSADGVHLLTADNQATYPVTNNVHIYVSSNSGTSWQATVVSNAFILKSPASIAVASSADGNDLALANGNTKAYVGLGGYAGSLYTLQPTPHPRLNISATVTNLAIGWIIPSANFVLQQSADLVNWSDATNVPELDYTNLEYETIVSPLGGCEFYRLATP